MLLDNYEIRFEGSGNIIYEGKLIQFISNLYGVMLVEKRYKVDNKNKMKESEKIKPYFKNVPIIRIELLKVNSKKVLFKKIDNNFK